ncbi:type IV pilus assembly protein PilN [Crenobacter luteus]|uniref:Fimbrial protein n=1 Tax=Crenobacter luteus TaxID=1452487 RepID=A0A165FJJ4_9NEIS|nr:PilN domain-containing protein [Crenobacter luteus]KZE33474.1 fimbrial protein [Crenobacter luteus]TCP13097.1 type IV pilus assembly protein PilN [Crenobacter luteus]
MIRINLLPHREQKKAQHRRRFQVLFGATLLGAALLVMAGYLVLDGRIAHQDARNAHLEGAIARLDEQIRSIESLKKERDALLARKQLVEKLQQSRGDATRLFDQLLRQTPDGVYLKDFRQNGTNFTLSGYALSGARVSNYMRALAESTVFDAPVLVEVKAAVVGNQRVSEFTLNLGSKPALAPTAQGATP